MTLLNTVLRIGSYIAWASLALWAFELVPSWVPVSIGYVGMLGCTFRAYLRTRPRA